MTSAMLLGRGMCAGMARRSPDDGTNRSDDEVASAGDGVGVEGGRGHGEGGADVNAGYGRGRRRRLVHHRGEEPPGGASWKPPAPEEGARVAAAAAAAAAAAVPVRHRETSFGPSRSARSTGGRGGAVSPACCAPVVPRRNDEHPHLGLRACGLRWIAAPAPGPRAPACGVVETRLRKTGNGRATRRYRRPWWTTSSRCPRRLRPLPAAAASTTAASRIRKRLGRRADCRPIDASFPAASMNAHS